MNGVLQRLWRDLEIRMGRRPSPAEQISAALNSNYGLLVRRYCKSRRRTLADCWTVTYDDILAEARRRGLNSFVTVESVREGWQLVKSVHGYRVIWVERGGRMYEKDFTDVESAFEFWLEVDLQAHRLPGRKAS